MQSGTNEQDSWGAGEKVICKPYNAIVEFPTAGLALIIIGSGEWPALTLGFAEERRKRLKANEGGVLFVQGIGFPFYPR